MLSVDDFEEELQEEYGKIFNNIAYIREKKRKYRVRQRENGKNGKNDSLTTYYKNDKGNVEILKNELTQTTDKLESQTVKQNAINRDESTGSKTVRWQMEGEEGLNHSESESRNSSLYEKIAMDLETVFNKHKMICPSPTSKKSLEGEKKLETAALDVPPNEHGTDREKAALRNEIKFKTVHTKNDTLYIWTANV